MMKVRNTLFLYASIPKHSTEGDIINSIEWSLLQDRAKCEQERKTIRRAHIGLVKTVIEIPELRLLEGTYSNYVLAQMQLQWMQCGLYTLMETSENEYVVKRDGKIRKVMWAEERHVATCTCKWPSSRLYPCRHVIRVAKELKRGITQYHTVCCRYTHKVAKPSLTIGVECQIGRRWLREVTYMEDGVVDVATRMHDEENGGTYADASVSNAEMPDNVTVSHETQQRTVEVKSINTSGMGPVERHNHLIKEGKSLAEVASRTPGNTHVAAIVLSALTKGMTGHNTAGVKTALEALLGELPSMVSHGQKISVKGRFL
jgi:hypothetical protein